MADPTATYKLPPTLMVALSTDRPELINILLISPAYSELENELFRLVRDMIRDRIAMREELNTAREAGLAAKEKLARLFEVIQAE